MAPVDKSTDGSDSADKSGTAPPSIGENKTIGGTSGQGLDQSGRQGTPVLDGAGYAETTMSSKLENADVLSEYTATYTSKTSYTIHYIKNHATSICAGMQ